MNEYRMRQEVLSNPDLTSTEKIVMFAILMKVDWKTFQGQVSVSLIAGLTSNTERTVKRAVKKLVESGWITRESTRLNYSKSTAALTTVLFNNVKNDTSVTNDTMTVSQMTPPSVTDDTMNSVKNDTHTISNNINTIQNNSLETEPHGEEEVDQNGFEDEFWIYPSSIQDASRRMMVQSYIQAHYHRMTESDRQRMLYPELAEPIWSTQQ